MKLVYAALVPVLLLCAPACVSVPRLIAEGELTDAYDKAHQRVVSAAERGRRPPRKRMSEYLSAHRAIQWRGLRRVRELTGQAGQEKFAELYTLYSNLHTRSLNLLALSPAADSTWLPSELEPDLLARSRDSAALLAGNYYLDLAHELLRPARLGDKPAARLAFAHYEKAAYFLPQEAGGFADTQDSLRDIGTLRIHVRPAGTVAERRAIWRALARKRSRRSGWTSVVVRPGSARVDLVAEVRYDGYSSHGPDESCSETTYDEEIVDHVERKTICERVDDSTVVQRVIEIEHMREISATVIECEQSASVRARGILSVYGPEGQRLVSRTRVAADEEWTYEYATYEGDRRALPGIAPSGTAARPPSTWQLLDEAQESLVDRAWWSIVRAYR